MVPPVGVLGFFGLDRIRVSAFWKGLLPANFTTHPEIVSDPPHIH